MRRFKIPVGVIVCLVLWLVALCVPTVRELGASFVYTGLQQLRGESPNGLSSDDLPFRPDDPTSVGWRAEDAALRGDKTALLALLQRFPSDIETRALVTRTSAFGLRLEAARSKPSAASRAVWIEAAQTAREGARLEPDNAFWPWIEATYEFAAGRDEAAFAAWKSALSCTRFEDYITPTAAARLHLAESERTLPWESRLAIWWGKSLVHLPAMQDSAKLAASRAKTLREQGDNAGALELEASVLNATGLERRDTQVAVPVMFAEMHGRLSLETFFGTPRETNRQFVDPRVLGAPLQRAWASYARQNGRPEWAGLADFVSESSRVSSWGIYLDSVGQSFGLRTPWDAIALGAPAAMLLLVATTGLGALLWLVGAVLKAHGEVPTRGQIAVCANFSLWLGLGAAAVFATHYRRNLSPLDSTVNETFGGVIFPWFALAAACWLLPIVALVWWRARLKRRTDPRARALSPVLEAGRKIFWASFALMALAVMFNPSDIWDRTILEWPRAPLLPVVLLVLAIALERERNRAPHGFGAVRVEHDRWFGWQLARRTLGVLLVSWSAVFLFVALAVWPLRAQLNRNLDRQTQIGEVEWMREQIAKTK